MFGFLLEIINLTERVEKLEEIKDIRRLLTQAVEIPEIPSSQQYNVVIDADVPLNQSFPSSTASSSQPQFPVTTPFAAPNEET